VVMHIFFEQSLLNQEDFSGLMDTLSAGGLFHKTLVGRPYDELAGYLPVDAYETLHSRRETAVGYRTGSRNWSTTDSHLPALENVASSYSGKREAILSDITYRYKTLPQLLNRTLPMLASDPEFQVTATRLRTEGWKEWHLLVAVAGIAMNARAQRRKIITAEITPETARRFQELYDEPENVAEAIEPSSAYSEKELRVHIGLAASSGVATNGMSLDISPVPQPELLKFLGNRYRYWLDDVEHSPIFSP